jgi:hypothetical protein
MVELETLVLLEVHSSVSIFDRTVG